MKQNRASCRDGIKITAAVVIVLLFGLIILTGSKKPGKLGTVNGIPFYQKELDLYKEEYRAKVAAAFADQHNLDSVGKEFWNTPYDGIRPEEVLTDQALEALIRDKIIQQEAVNRNIVAPLDFLELEKAYQEQMNANNNNTLVYGPSHYSLEEYRQYLMTQTIDELKKTLLEDELKPTQEQLKQSFAALPATLKEKDFHSSGYRIQSKNQEYEALHELENKLAAGEVIPDIIEEQKEHQNLSIEPFTLDTRNIHREDVSAIELTGLLFPVGAGEFVSTFISGEPVIYYIETKDGGGYLTYEEAPGWGRNKWINDQFELYIDHQVQMAVIETELKTSFSR